MKKYYKKVLKELIEYIEWNNEIEPNEYLKDDYSPLIWMFYYQKYNYNVRLYSVFLRNCSKVILYDYRDIYYHYISDNYFKQGMKEYIDDIEYSITEDVLINMKYELVLKLNLLFPVKMVILSYLIPVYKS